MIVSSPTPPSKSPSPSPSDWANPSKSESAASVPTSVAESLAEPPRVSDSDMDVRSRSVSVWTSLSDEGGADRSLLSGVGSRPLAEVDG